jgi:hypothetical protein
LLVGGSRRHLTGPSREAPQEGHRVHLPPVTPDLEMQVRSRGVPGLAAQSNDLTPLNFLTPLHQDCGEMGIDRHDSAWMVEPDHSAISAHGSGVPDLPLFHGPDLGSIRDLDIHPSVKIRFEALEADAEWRHHRALNRPSGD